MIICTSPVKIKYKMLMASIGYLPPQNTNPNKNIYKQHLYTQALFHNK